MAKYLRYIAVHDETLSPPEETDDTAHLPWMYEQYATPVLSNGISKVNVYFLPERPPETAPYDDGLGIAYVRHHFDRSQSASLSGTERKVYYLDRLHEAILRCARQFGWSEKHFSDARERMLADDLRFAFFWKKPLSSPDRSMKVQGFVEAGPRTRVWLVFMDRSGIETQRCLLTVRGTGSSDMGHLFGEMRWTDAHTVQVTMKNGRDYWRCTADGLVEFHYPRAEGGDASGLYALGRMYMEGEIVLQDVERGMRLLREAAQKGDMHAQRYLERNAAGT